MYKFIELLGILFPVLLVIALIIALVTSPYKEACAATHSELYDTSYLSAKDFYANVFDNETYIDKVELKRFIRREERAIRTLANKFYACLPDYEGLLFTVYLYQLGAGFIAAKENTDFRLTKQFGRFSAHRIIKLGAFLHHSINC